MEAFPEAKVVLSIRDPSTWYDSVKSTIYQQKLLSDDFAVRIFLRFQGALDMLSTIVGTTGSVPKNMDKGKELKNGV